MSAKIYLGDSVYAEFDGDGVILTTNNGYADDPRNTIYLESQVLTALNRFVERECQKLTRVSNEKSNKEKET